MRQGRCAIGRGLVNAKEEREDFTTLRPRNRYYGEFTRWFGVDQIANVTLAFRERDIEKLCSRLRQARRRGERSLESTVVGRPSVQTLIRPCILS